MMLYINKQSENWSCILGKQKAVVTKVIVHFESSFVTDSMFEYQLHFPAGTRAGAVDR